MNNNSVQNASRDARTLPDHVASCASCDSEKWTDFFISRHVMPVDVGSSLSSEVEACAAPLADITLAYCYCCGLAWNRTFNSSQ